MSVGTQIRLARLAKNWSQDDLAHEVREITGGKVRLAASELSRYERGIYKSPRIATLSAIAKATEQPIEYFTDPPATEASTEDDEESALRRVAARAATNGDTEMLADLMPALRRFDRERVKRTRRVAS